MIPNAMRWKYNAKCADNEAGDDIVVWEHLTLPQPSKAQIAIDVAEYEQSVIDEKVKDDAFNTKKSIDIAALGTRVEMRAATAAANSIPGLRERIAQLEEIVYSNEKGTID